MDKYEYKVRSEEIKDLIAKKKYTEAMKIADMIDWRRVKNISMLCTISDLYKLNRRFEESREILLLAYERHPGGRMIVYSLCELSIKLDDVVQAVEYYKEFVQIAPRDNGRYILQYKLYEAQGVTLEERIEVLEELKKREYREKWAYELAYLYHRIGLATKCVEECDELILWFGEGKYVVKAMELKMLHAPLSAGQQEKYSRAKGEPEPVMVPQPKELDFEVPPVNVGEYATINLQKEIAEGVKEVLGEENELPQSADTIEYTAVQETSEYGMDTDELINFEKNAAKEYAEYAYALEEAEEIKEAENISKIREDAAKEEIQPAEISIEAAGDFTREIISSLLSQGTDHPQEVPPAEEEEIFFEDGDTSEIPSVVYTQENASENDIFVRRLPFEDESCVVKMSNTGEIPRIIQSPSQKSTLQKIQEVQEVFPAEENERIFSESEQIKTEPEQEQAEQVQVKEEPEPITEEPKKPDMPSAESMAKEKNENYDSLLSQEYNGQIRLAVFQEKEAVEKQITGQMNIEDVLLEWERIKKEKEEKRAEEVRQRVKAQTGELFSQFDASTKQGLLAELDALAEESIRKEKSDAAVKKTEEKNKNQTAEAENRSEVEEKIKAAPEKSSRAVRAMTAEEKKLFGPFIQTKSTRNQIIETLDQISLASCTGNVILTSDPGMDSIKLAKNIIREVRMSDSNFSGKMAKITGQAFNGKDLEKAFDKLSNGALIIEGAGKLKEKTVHSMTKLLEQEKSGIIIILEDTRININKLLENHKELTNNFNLRIDIEAMDNDTLVLFGKRYALEREYTIDELGVLALYTRIAELQTSEHSVTTREVKEIVEGAIYHANRKTVGHFMDILFRRRYDEEDMIILRERDFI